MFWPKEPSTEDRLFRAEAGRRDFCGFRVGEVPKWKKAQLSPSKGWSWGWVGVERRGCGDWTFRPNLKPASGGIATLLHLFAFFLDRQHSLSSSPCSSRLVQKITNHSNPAAVNTLRSFQAMARSWGAKIWSSACAEQSGQPAVFSDSSFSYPTISQALACMALLKSSDFTQAGLGQNRPVEATQVKSKKAPHLGTSPIWVLLL